MSVTNYASAAEFLAGGRDKHSRPIENNTRVERRDEGIAIRLHGTDVVTYFPDGSVELNTGGWYTVTTKDRINSYLGSRVQVWSERGRWFLSSYDPNAGEWTRFEAHPEWDYQSGKRTNLGPFFDGIRLDANGTILNPLPAEDQRVQDAARKDIEKKLASYIKGFVAALERGTIETPNGGDCWFCHMFEPGGVPTNNEHLLSHLDERYFVGSLLFNAVRERGYGDWKFVMGLRLDTEAYEQGKLKTRRAWGGTDAPDHGSSRELARDLRRYLKKRLLPGGGVTPVGVGITTTPGSGYYGI